MIFTAGVRPESIERVVATDERNREALIDVLKKEGFVPHNGLSIEDFVILEPNFFVFGPSPYECDDPKAFAKNAMKEAKAGNPNALKWFLIEGPETAIKERAKYSSARRSRPPKNCDPVRQIIGLFCNVENPIGQGAQGTWKSRQ